MDYAKLTNLFRRMLDHTVSTRQLADQNYANSIDFWGSDSYAWMIAEGYPSVEIKPDDSHGPSFSLIGDGLLAHDEFINELYCDKRIKQAVDLKALEKLIERLLRKYNAQKVAETAAITESIKIEIKQIKDSIKSWTAIAPVDFLIFENMKELAVGKVTFKAGADVVEYAKNQFYQRIDSNDSSDQDKSVLKAWIAKEIPKYFNPRFVAANVSVESEASKTTFLAEDEIELSLNLLRCYTHLLFSPGFRVRMGLRHATGNYLRPAFGFSSTDNSWTLDSYSVGLQQPFVIDSKQIEFLQQYYAFDELSNIIAKNASERTKLEKLIVIAIHWLGRGISENGNANKVLHFAAASETLIMGQVSEGEITEKFSRRLAFLISSNPETRANLFARSKSLYSKRSKVIHAGNTSIEDSDVLALEILTLRALVEMAKKSAEWQSHSDFLSWFNAVSFGG